MHKDARPKGATLYFTKSLVSKLWAEAGLMAAFKANYLPGTEQLRIVDKYANIMFEDKPKTEEEISRPEIDRSPLQQITGFTTARHRCMEQQFHSFAGRWQGLKRAFKSGSFALVEQL